MATKSRKKSTPDEPIDNAEVMQDAKSAFDIEFPPLPEGDTEEDKEIANTLVKKLSAAIKEANGKVSTHQKKQIYESLKNVMSDGSYKQIITGFYLAKKNYDLGKAILMRLNNCIAETDDVIKNLYSPHKAKEAVEAKS